MQSDLVFSLGPNCRNAFNLRHHFAFDRAYPFDWWVTPAASMLRLIDRGHAFNVTRQDLVLSDPVGENTVYNRNYHLLHHHDFPREGGVIRRIEDADIEAVNTKYRALFARMHADIDAASRPVAVLNGIACAMPSPEFPGIEFRTDLDRWLEPDEFAYEVRARLGRKVRVLLIEVDTAERRFQEHEWGWVVSQPDPNKASGLPEGHFAEPMWAFVEAYERVRLTLERARA